MSSQIKDICTACDICRPLCPTESIFKGKLQYYIDADTCQGCLICIDVCPESAVVAGKKPSKKPGPGGSGQPKKPADSKEESPKKEVDVQKDYIG